MNRFQRLDHRSNSTSRLSFPPEPFRYRIPPYYDSQLSIFFTDYGLELSQHDAERTLLEAQVIIMREMAQDPSRGDLPVGSPTKAHPSLLRSLFIYLFVFSTYFLALRCTS